MIHKFQDDHYEKLQKEITRASLYYTDYCNHGQRVLTKCEFTYVWLLHAGITHSMVQKYYGITEESFGKKLALITRKMGEDQYTSDFFLRVFEKTLR